MEAFRQSSSRGPVVCFWNTNRKQNTLLLAPKKHGVHRQLPTPRAATSVPSSSTSDNPQCTSTSNIFLEASRSEVRHFIPTDSEQNKGDDREKGDNEEVQSNNESNRDRESEEDKDETERFIDLDVEMLNDIAVWPTTLTDLMIDYIIRKKPNKIGNIETLKSVYKDRDQRLPEIKKKSVQKLKDIYKDDTESFNFDDELDLLPPEASN
ncbi:hypothetical protein NPIL_426351 [Nephila pilipes]|uniref:Uncharacterized protein n=1 Tax=Nephila pilipes TaxID=299642 RepID=A0A8X6UVQ6_NEPPI|nr:hypothetical protein NPIL_426351 [Nephila pilipes]